MAGEESMRHNEVVCVCVHIISQEKNVALSFVTTCIELEVIILSEISQNQTNKYHTTQKQKVDLIKGCGRTVISRKWKEQRKR